MCLKIVLLQESNKRLKLLFGLIVACAQTTSVTLGPIWSDVCGKGIYLKNKMLINKVRANEDLDGLKLSGILHSNEYVSAVSCKLNTFYRQLPQLYQMVVD